MLNRRLVAIVVALGLGAFALVRLFPPDGTSSTRAVNGMTLVELADGQVRVQTMAGRGPVDYWCAAGQALHTQATDANMFHLAVARQAPDGPVFAVGDGSVSGETLDLETVGLTQSFAAAIGLCEASQRRIDGN